MLYTEQTKKALIFCYEAHRNQFDKGGMPYVFHPVHLAEQMTTEAETIAALLHDTVEDTEWTLEDLQNMGFPQEALNAVRLMTHDPSVPYLDYVAALRANPTARAVKLADLKHNSDLSRLDSVDAAALERVKKYAQAIKLLEK